MSRPPAATTRAGVALCVASIAWLKGGVIETALAAAGDAQATVRMGVSKANGAEARWEGALGNLAGE